jgi:hypothetical protein
MVFFLCSVAIGVGGIVDCFNFLFKVYIIYCLNECSSITLYSALLSAFFNNCKRNSALFFGHLPCVVLNCLAYNDKGVNFMFMIKYMYILWIVKQATFCWEHVFKQSIMYVIHSNNSIILGFGEEDFISECIIGVCNYVEFLNKMKFI